MNYSPRVYDPQERAKYMMLTLCGVIGAYALYLNYRTKDRHEGLF